MVDLPLNPSEYSKKTLEHPFEKVNNLKIKDNTTQTWDQHRKKEYQKLENLIEKQEVFGSYSSLLPKNSKEKRKFVIGGLGIGKSSLINYYTFNDLMVLQIKFKYVVDIFEELKIQLNKESIIVHANFVEYIGDTIETVEKKDTKQKFFEVHINLQKNFGDDEFLNFYKEIDLRNFDQNAFQILIYGIELEMPEFEINVMNYVKGISKFIEKIEQFSQGKVIWEEALERFEIVVTKAYILWNRATIREKLEETLKCVNDFETDELKIKKYRKILGYFMERTEKIFLFFRLDKEGGYNEIIRGYDMASQ